MFYTHPQMADGHVNKCKTCNKRDVSENYQSNRNYYIAYEQERWKNPDRRAKLREYKQSMRQRSPGKERARNKVSNAIRSGKLKRGLCIVCSSTKTEAHHTDYRRPLVVQWLCRKHHLEREGKRAYAT